MLKRALVTFAELALWLVMMAILLSVVSHSAARAAETKHNAQKPKTMTNAPLIPRDVLFGNPKRAQARISHDGKWISFQAPVNGVLNIWVAPVDHIDKAQPVTQETGRPIPSYHWAYDNTHILFVNDTNGDENFHVYAVDVAAREKKDLTPIKGVRAEIEAASEKFLHEILVGLNDRDPRYHDIWRINIDTGEKKLVVQNPGIA